MTILSQPGGEAKTVALEEIFDAVTEISQLETNNPDEIIEFGLKSHRLATLAASNHFGDLLVQKLDQATITKLQDFSLLFETTLDETFMEGVMSGKFSNPDQHPLQPIYNLLAKREYDLVLAYRKQARSKPWIHVGSGYPETAIGLNRQFDVPVICIDQDKEVVRKAETVLRKLNLWGEDKLMMVNANGRDIIPDGEVVIISAMVPNNDKEIIIDNMRRLTYGNQDEPLLVLRTPADPAFTILYPTLFNEGGIADWKLRNVSDSQVKLTPKEWLRSMLFEVVETAGVRRGFDRIPVETRVKLKPLS